IGNWHLRGISGGEKRRLSITLEILTRPTLLFLDEPTNGLDNASVYFVAQTLINLAHDAKTVISSIHQPSSEAFALFDHLFLLSEVKQYTLDLHKRQLRYSYSKPNSPIFMHVITKIMCLDYIIHAYVLVI
ncbi:hypothetical protein V8G54_006780, partial [Vigna mungo]